ncbi:MAG: flagellar filament capping protein FliD [Gammaproteobacteria bacterium]
MASITTPGIGSGLDINSLVSQLVEAENKPIVDRLDRREAKLQARLSAFGTLKSALSTAQTSLASLNNASTFRAREATSSDTDVISASSSSLASPGKYDVAVTQLADSHKLSTDPTLANAQFTSETAVVGTGSLVFKFGTTVYDKPTDSYTSFTQNAEKATATVEITDGSLKGIRDAVNEADIGVNASIIYDGSYYRLTFTSETGAANSLEISATDDDTNNTDDSGLSLLAFNSAATHLEQNGAAQDATMTINGIGVNSATNTLKDTIGGLTMDLLKVGTATLEVKLDKGSASTAIAGFVGNFNGLISTINELSKYNPDTQESGLLNGDGVLRNIETQVRRMLSTQIEGVSGPYSSLADIGITRSSSDGTLVLDNNKLDKAIGDNFDDVAAIFAAVGAPTDSLIEFDSSSALTQAGSHAVTITQLATQASITGSAAANLTITGGSNDTISVDVDGVSANVTLTAGTYTAAALAAEVQSQINGTTTFKDAGVSVEVSEAAGILTLKSKKYGSESSVNIAGGNGRDGLVGTTPTISAGLNVAGKIGSSEATGDGQYLTGTGAAQGLKVLINGGATGSRGTIAFSQGYAYQLNAMMSSLLGSDSIFASVTDSLTDQIKDVTEDREAQARRIDTYEQRIRGQFIAMDALVSQLRTTSDFLTSQLANLPGFTRKDSTN